MSEAVAGVTATGWQFEIEGKFIDYLSSRLLERRSFLPFFKLPQNVGVKNITRSDLDGNGNYWIGDYQSYFDDIENLESCQTIEIDTPVVKSEISEMIVHNLGNPQSFTFTGLLPVLGETHAIALCKPVDKTHFVPEMLKIIEDLGVNIPLLVAILQYEINIKFSKNGSTWNLFGYFDDSDMIAPYPFFDFVIENDDISIESGSENITVIIKSRLPQVLSVELEGAPLRRVVSHPVLDAYPFVISSITYYSDQKWTGLRLDGGSDLQALIDGKRSKSKVKI